MYTEETLNRFLEDLASSSPTPGGGSSAALVGAIAAGLVSMVGRLTVGREKFREVEADAQRLLERSEVVRAEFARLIQADIDAFEAVSQAYKLPKVSEEEKAARASAVQASLVIATDAPIAIARAAAEVLALSEPMAKIGNPQAISDIGVAALAADACLRSAALNVEINLKHMKDEVRVAAYRGELAMLGERRGERLEQILTVVRERL